VAILIECLTDNRNRSASDVKVAVTRNGGTMADVGSVSRIFDRKGVVEVAKAQGGKGLDEDDLLEATLDADPEDVSDEGEVFRVISDPSLVVDVRKAVHSAGLDYESAEVQFVPQYTQSIDARDAAEKLFRLLDAIEDVDDVQTVYSNEEVPEAVLAELD
jgi:YebC/PmpR family DNA-binding regulatory protein